MNFGALFIVAIGFVLIVIGWRGTYGKVWTGFSNYTAGGSMPNQTPTNQPGSTPGVSIGGGSSSGVSSSNPSSNPGPRFPPGSQSGV